MKITEEDIYVQFGAGNEAVARCKNFYVSPRLSLQRLPLIGRVFCGGCIFESVVLHGDLVKGLLLSPNTVKELFASHVLEHLSYDDALTALKNSSKMLKPGGFFRMIVPNFKFYVDDYRTKLSSDGNVKSSSAYDFNPLS